MEPGPQLQWRTWWKDEAKTIEQQSRARGMEISQDQLFREGDYANGERQSLYDAHTLALCHTVVLNAWDKIGEIGKKIE